MSAEQIFAAIQTLPLRERLRLLERVIHVIASSAEEEAAGAIPPRRSAMGLWADEAGLAD